ncbi:MAG: hypothetical protein WA906_03185 [Pacificimonas sp.]
MTIYRDRIHAAGRFAGQTERYEPSLHTETGMWELADPAIGSDNHHQKNAIFVKELDAALHLIRKHRFSLRMTGNLTGQRNLISAQEIEGL